MRRNLNPLGLITLAALATPLVVKAAKPAAKKVGQSIRKLGDKLVESVEKMESEDKAKKSAKQHEHGPGATRPEDNEETTPQTAPDPKEGAETHVPDPSETPSEPKPAQVPTEAPNQQPSTEPTEIPDPKPAEAPKTPKAKATKVKQSKPSNKKAPTKSGSKTVKAQKSRRQTRDVGETG